ncbi:unnamed protein product [marine sediment metagenome]|uniref:Uncharacterized protein n=1 Tax=marine sediment metagenome TaxID=412755 RepID=X1NMK8_9ZZZZ
MKVYIKKGQDEKKGLFGGHKGMKFSLSCRIELTSSESALIEKYRVWEYSVLSFKDKRGNNITQLFYMHTLNLFVEQVLLQRMSNTPQRFHTPFSFFYAE